MVRALASHQCGQVSISAIRWVESVVGSHLAPRVFLFLPTRPEMSIRIKKTAKVDVPSSLNIVIYFFYDYFFLSAYTYQSRKPGFFSSRFIHRRAIHGIKLYVV